MKVVEKLYPFQDQLHVILNPILLLHLLLERGEDLLTIILIIEENFMLKRDQR